MVEAKPISSFEGLMAQLEAENLLFRRVESEDTVSVPTRLGDGNSVLHIRWEAVPGVVHFL